MTKKNFFNFWFEWVKVEIHRILDDEIMRFLVFLQAGINEVSTKSNHVSFQGL